ncbi:MAG: carbon-nitrogen family hydrolase [Synergistaceae bacterium]|nr:carbon-nitrogen family hydrolase [Synergistaceae bacterium]
MSLLRLAVAQIEITAGDRRANYEKVERMLDSKWVKSDTPTAVILPEIWDVGYVIEESHKYGDRNASEAAEFLGKLAVKYNCWFTGGSILALTDKGAANRAMVIDPSGNYVTSYDKIHLIPLMDEEKFLISGDKGTLFKIGNIQAALAICYDLRFCELTRRYAAEGAELQFFAAEWPASRIDHWCTLLQARAIENMTFVAACNRVGTTDGTLFGGHSMVVDPWGEILYQGGMTEDFAFVEIETSKVRKAREFLKVFEMRKPELY